MKEILISQIAPIAATAITAILCIILKQVGNAGIDLIVTKKKETEQKIEVSGYKSKVDQAFEVWNIVDDKFRLTQNAMEIFGSKEKLFEDILLQRIPGLNQKNIDDLRDTISGIVNKGRKAVIPDDTAQKMAALQEDYDKLKTENNILKSAISQVGTTVQTLSLDTKQDVKVEEEATNTVEETV